MSLQIYENVKNKFVEHKCTLFYFYKQKFDLFFDKLNFNYFFLAYFVLPLTPLNLFQRL